MYKMFGGSVVAVAFQSTFYLKMHKNNIFIKVWWKCGSRSTKHRVVCYQTPCCVCFTANTKTDEKQRQSKNLKVIRVKLCF
jgi:predicted transporter